MIGFQKPKRRIVDRIAYKRDAEQKAREFRAAVWARDEGRCRHCNRKVIHTIELLANRGEVHHRHGRNVAPEHRYTVAEAVLLCALCHGDPDVVAKFRRAA